MKPGSDIRERIERLHAAMLAALHVDHFPPGPGDAEGWRAFLFVLDTLAETPGGPLAPRDIRAAVDLMRAQNRSGEAKWALRYFKIMGQPEAFRDLVLESRRRHRPRPPVVERPVTTPVATTLQPVDTAAESGPQSVKHLADEWFREHGLRR
jgi:hypothetical protein